MLDGGHIGVEHEGQTYPAGAVWVGKLWIYDIKHFVCITCKQPNRVVSSLPASRTELQDEQCCGQS